MVTKPDRIGYEWSARYRALDAIYIQLPKSPGWSASKRQRWLSALAAALDLEVEVEGPQDNGA